MLPVKRQGWLAPLSLLAAMAAPARAVVVVSADFDVPTYTTGTLNGQGPVEPASSASQPWIEQNGGSDYQVEFGGLNVPSKGTVGPVNGGTGRAKENGFESYRVNRTFSWLTGTETELWFRLVLKPISTSMGNTIFRSDALDSRMVIYANSNFSLTSSFGSSAAVATGASTPFDLSSTNLIILHQLIDRATGQPEKTYGWINPASMANMLADAGYNVYLESNIIEGSESYNKLFLNWENSNTAGDSIAIATSLTDLVQPVPGPIPLVAAPTAFAVSRRLRQRLSGARRSSSACSS